MQTLTVEIPRVLSTPSARPKPANPDRGGTHRPERVRWRTRRDVLRMFVGSDGNSFPHRPRKRHLR